MPAPTQAARYAGVSRSTLDRWRKEAGLKSIRIGGRVIIRRETLDAYLSDLEANGDGPNRKELAGFDLPQRDQTDWHRGTAPDAHHFCEPIHPKTQAKDRSTGSTGWGSLVRLSVQQSEHRY